MIQINISNLTDVTKLGTGGPPIVLWVKFNNRFFGKIALIGDKVLGQILAPKADIYELCTLLRIGDI